MSFLQSGNPPNSFPAGENINDSRALLMLQAKLEVKSMSDLLLSLQTTCYNRCVSSNHSNEALTLSETICLDRCTTKVLEAHNVIGENMVEMQKEMAANGNPSAF